MADRSDTTARSPSATPAQDSVGRVVRCIECGTAATLVGGDRIYPHRRDLYAKSFWLCRCGAYCGCHGSTTEPLGYPCGPETRKARSAAHAAFDPIWRSGAMSRSSAYKALADRLGISRSVCHIGMMDAATAGRVPEIARSLPTGGDDAVRDFGGRSDRSLGGLLPDCLRMDFHAASAGHHNPRSQPMTDYYATIIDRHKAAQAERDRIVAWLRRIGKPQLADAIERGEHLK